MGIPVDDPVAVVHFVPDRRLAALAAAGALAFSAASAVLADPAGRILTGLAALLLLGVAGNDWVARLTVCERGITVRSLLARTELAWADIERVVVDERFRAGVASRTLEIDAGARLLVLGRHALGADPRDVLPVLQAFRARWKT